MEKLYFLSNIFSIITFLMVGMLLFSSCTHHRSEKKCIHPIEKKSNPQKQPPEKSPVENQQKEEPVQKPEEFPNPFPQETIKLK